MLVSLLGERFLTVADGFYSKYSWIIDMAQLGLHGIGTLRYGANLKSLCKGACQEQGELRRWRGKVHLKDLCPAQQWFKNPLPL
jgi:hypothetical protein